MSRSCPRLVVTTLVAAIGFGGAISGAGAMRPVQPAQPPATAPSAEPATYRHLVIDGDPSPAGDFDAAVIFPGGKRTGWMAYSTSDFKERNGFQVQDLATAIATSNDGGASWRYVATLDEPYDATITTPDTSLCGQPRCSGRVVSEVPFLVFDPKDPNPDRRYKLYASRYFSYPPANAEGSQGQVHLGVITLRTASRPDGKWSKERPAFGWNFTPNEMKAPLNLNTVDPKVADCLLFAEGDAIAVGNDLDFAFTCPIASPGGRVRYRIILFRSSDHGRSVRYVGTIVQPDDAKGVDADSFIAADLFRKGNDTFLLATRVRGQDQYDGCVVIPFDRRTGAARRDAAGMPVVRMLVPTLGGRFGGACSWDAGGTGSGIVISQVFSDEEPLKPFRVYATGTMP